MCLPITKPGFAESKPLVGVMLGKSKEYQELLRTQWLMANCLFEMTVNCIGIWIQSIESCLKISFLKKE